MQKTIQVTPQQDDLVKEIQEQLGYDALYKAYSKVIEVGIKKLLSDGYIDDLPTQAPLESIIDYDLLSHLLLQARQGQTDLFLAHSPWKFLLLFERMLGTYNDFDRQLFIYQYVSKTSYVLYLFTEMELKSVHPGWLLVPDLMYAKHPLLEVLEDIKSIELSTKQQTKVKDLLLQYHKEVE